MNHSLNSRLWIWIGVMLLMGACRNSTEKPTLWIYTSVYKEVISKYQEPLAKEFPNIEIKWFQSGSENVAAKLLAQISAGSTQADIIMTSDLFFFQELSRLNKLAPLDFNQNENLNPEWVGPDRHYALLRFPVMVLAYNSSKISKELIPKSFKNLTDPHYKDLLTMPSPLESGTALISAIFLYKQYGRDYFKSLRRNQILAQGGNGASLARIQSGERPVGMVLMENVLLSKSRHSSPVQFVVPEEGGIAVPSPIGILNTSKNISASQKVSAWFLNQYAQDLIASVGRHYPAINNTLQPEGAPTWSALKTMPWSLSTFESLSSEKSLIKEEFQNIILRR